MDAAQMKKSILHKVFNQETLPEEASLLFWDLAFETMVAEPNSAYTVFSEWGVNTEYQRHDIRNILLDEMRKRIAAQKAQKPVIEWIPVADVLPVEPDDYLVADVDGWISTAGFDGCGWRVYDDLVGEPEFWSPLPQRPGFK